jgi:transcriptional regulator
MGTLRQEMIALLMQAPLDVRDLATALEIRDTEAAEHLEHIARSIKNQGRALQITPAYCRQCDYAFRKRQRFTRPGRCPHCKSSWIQGAVYFIED